MIRIIRQSWFLVVLFLMAACAANHNIYYWGNYSETAYDYKKTPTDETKKAHIMALQDIVEHAADKHKGIPPGIYAELAYFSIEDKNYELARDYLNRELALFPESSVLISQILNKLNEGS